MKLPKPLKTFFNGQIPETAEERNEVKEQILDEWMNKEVKIKAYQTSYQNKNFIKFTFQ